MTRRLARSLPLLAAAVALLLPRAAAPAVEAVVDASIQLHCADAAGAAHPKKMTLVSEVRLDGLDPEEPPRLLVGYSQDGRETRFKGKLRAKVKHIAAAGGTTKLGKLKTVQNGGNGDAVREKALDLELADGDLIEWNFKFSKFDRLEPGDCFSVFAGLASPAQDCGPYPDWTSSDYLLPYRPGTSLVVSQGNCSIGSHQRAANHAYDFAMPIGTEIVAARAGTVVAVDDSAPDGTGLFADDNAVVVEHEDGTLASYVHIQQGGARVSEGEGVEAGQLIALSGNSGHTGGLPHLHLQVTTCGNRNVCGTEPITFSNTSANPKGLEVGRSYKAK